MTVEHEYRNSVAEVEVRAAGRRNKLVGHAALFNTLSPDLGGFKEQIAPGAFHESIAQDDVRALFNHNPDKVLARSSTGTLRLREDGRGLEFEIDLPNNATGRDVAELVRRGDVAENSFGFICQDEGVLRHDPPVRELRQIKLLDVSPVTYPAYPQTEVALRRVREQVGWMPSRERHRGGKAAVRRAELDRLERQTLEAAHSAAIGEPLRFGTLDFRDCLGGGRVVICGTAAPYGERGYPRGGREKKALYLARGCFSRTFLNGGNVILNLGHGGSPIADLRSGRLRLWEGRDGLRFALLLPDTDEALHAAKQVRDGVLPGASLSWINRDRRHLGRDVDELHDADVDELSLVDNPAFPGATAHVSWLPSGENANRASKRSIAA